jgi:CheY-like chemotaxis protein
VPLVSPVTSRDVTDAGATRAAPWATPFTRTSTWYPVIAEPPLLTGAVHRTVAEALPPVAAPIVGAAGTVAGTVGVTVFDAADGAPTGPPLPRGVLIPQSGGSGEVIAAATGPTPRDRAGPGGNAASAASTCSFVDLARPTPGSGGSVTPHCGLPVPARPRDDVDVTVRDFPRAPARGEPGPAHGTHWVHRPEEARVIRVLLADDNVFVRSALVDLLSAGGDIEVVAECADGDEVVAAAELTCPDVVILDLAMARVSGLAAARRLLAVQPESRIVILTATLSAAAVREAHALGAVGYLLKDAEPDELPGHVRTVAAGGTVWRPDRGAAPSDFAFLTQSTFPGTDRGDASQKPC